MGCACVALTHAELFWARCACSRRSEGTGKPILLALSELGFVADRRACDCRDSDREPSRDYRRLFIKPAGHSAWTVAAHGNPSHIGSPRRTDFYAPRQHAPADG